MSPLIIYCLVALVLATALCIIAGKRHPWLVQTAYAATVVGSLLTAAKIVPIVDGVFVSVAVGLYSASFLFTDYISEMFGKAHALRAVYMGIVAEAIVLVAVLFAVYVPGAPFFEAQEAYEAVFGVAPRIMAASISAFVIAQLADVAVFHRIREATGDRLLFVRNNVSTVVGQTLDTVVFYTIAFLGVPGVDLLALIVTTLVVKAIVAGADTVFLYVARWAANRRPDPDSTGAPA